MNSELITRPTLCPKDKDAGISMHGPFDGFISWYQTMAMVIAIGIIYSNLPIYTYVLQPTLLPKFFFFGLFLLFSPLLLLKYRALGTYLMSPFVLWASVLIILNLIHLSSFSAGSGITDFSLISNHMESRNALILTRIQYVLFSLFLGFAVFVGNKRSYLRTFIVLAAFLPCTIILDFVNPGLLYPVGTPGSVLGRAAAMFINPTMAAEAVLLIFLFACAAMKTKYRVLFLILSGAGIAVTFTRSAIIAWLILWLLLVVKRILPKSTMIIMTIVVAASLLSFGAFENYLGSRQDFDGAIENMVARLNFFSSARLGDDSAIERAEVIRMGWDVFLQNPVFGSGAGATQFWSQRASTHNQLLLLAVEYGILGIGLWVWLAIILLKGEFFQNKNLQFAIAFLFVFMSMFTHQMFDSASYWLATFAMASVRKRGISQHGRGD